MKVARNGGFTLLEMLIVFSVVLVLAALAVPTLGSAVRHQEEMYMLAVLRADLYGAQQHAIARRVNVAVFFTDGGAGYKAIDATSGRQIVARSLPSPWRFRLGTLRNPLIFTDNGNIERAGTIWIGGGQITYKVTFLLGKGRFYVQKM
ncbi:competence type IV pilus minor pilin ComGD [Anoxybacillus geothermalis]|nr:competence type IV pilus minor pilin ComGD [Geobacillus stearothermophilus]MDF9295539.1 competence type IV pilus minor pilin ComGD [Geobacillus stearothermophilus]MED0654112.1 competence type IV pilus minor pilin ComGD [Anoxybacillus geothermalis]